MICHIATDNDFCIRYRRMQFIKHTPVFSGADVTNNQQCTWILFIDLRISIKKSGQSFFLS